MNECTQQVTHYDVSLQTAKIIQCIGSLNDLYSQISEAIEPLSGGNVDAVMTNEFLPSVEKIQNTIERWIGRSVAECQSVKGSNKI